MTKVENGDYVTGITKTADGKGMTFTFSKGSTVTVTLDVKDGEAGAPGTPGKDAQQVTVDEKTGELKIDGKGTGIFPAKDAAKAPVKAEGGLTLDFCKDWLQCFSSVGLSIFQYLLYQSMV